MNGSTYILFTWQNLWPMSPKNFSYVLCWAQQSMIMWHSSCSWPGLMFSLFSLWTASSKSRADWIVKYIVLRRAIRLVSVASTMVSFFSSCSSSESEELPDSEPPSLPLLPPATRWNYLLEIKSTVGIVWFVLPDNFPPLLVRNEAGYQIIIYT